MNSSAGADQGVLKKGDIASGTLNTSKNLSHEEDFHDLSMEFEVQLEPDSTDTEGEEHSSAKHTPENIANVCSSPISKNLVEKKTNDLPEESIEFFETNLIAPVRYLKNYL